jgi:hypothetical protein
MSVSCGDPQSREVVEAPSVGCINPIAPPCNISVSYPAVSPVYGCPGCGCGCGCRGANGNVPLAYRSCPENAPPYECTQPAWTTNYHPAWYFCDRMLFHPADYSRPYPYRERFPYAGYDPRCQCAVPPIGF